MNKVWILLSALFLLNACASKPEPECTSCNSVVIAPPRGMRTSRPSNRKNDLLQSSFQVDRDKIFRYWKKTRRNR